MWFPIRKGNAKRNRFSILEPVCTLERSSKCEINELSPLVTYYEVKNNINDNYRNNIADYDKNKIDENLFKEEIIKNLKVTYCFYDLVTSSNEVYRYMEMDAVGVTFDIIKKMDDILWDEIRKIYEILKKNNEITFLELFNRVHNIIVNIYDLNVFAKILSVYNDQNIREAVFEIGRFLLSTYHEVFIITPDENGNKTMLTNRAVKSEDFLTKYDNDEQKAIVLSKVKSDQYINKTSMNSQKLLPLSKRKCYAGNVLNRRLSVNRIKSTNIQTLSKVNRNDTNKAISDITMEKPLSRKQLLRSVSEKQCLSVCNGDEDYSDININIDNIYNEPLSKTLTTVLCSSNIYQEKSQEILLLIKTMQQNRNDNKVKCDQTINNDTGQVQEIPIDTESKMAKLISSFRNILSSFSTIVTNNLLRFFPNLVLMILFLLYKRNQLLTSNIFLDMMNSFKLGIRDSLLRTLTLLEN